MMTLVIYDISNDDSRTKLANLLQDFGLERIQYSGFKGDLNTHDRHILAQQVKKFVTGERDSVYIIRLCNECASLCHIVSSKEAIFIDKSHVKIV
ncbi:CRISPR-associated endonuclease Cas2 [Candidatus Hecatella orcuttiae]|jgi:CRISPR-associated protein Cas2|uniref:CRISPR-associated endonuclease Cas2 n=1 Tax=Candidatus Hecatella orcuttiae TaxID=1935119 RepID=UPI002868380E|nr:CRISPR-associated endonuclease Cas2 [Candidatus Hecatella orcuttiae]